MPERDLATLVRSLTPGALRLYKQQLSSLPERDKQVAFSKLAGIEELADIVGRPAQRLTPKPVREQPEPKAVQQEVPLWAKGLQAAGAPFNWIQERITEPFGAVATAPFTPGLPGGRQRGESPLAYARRQYEQWEQPTWTMPWGGEFRPTKGIVETLPWFALPTAGGIVGKLGGLAAKGGALGKAAGYGAAALKPVAVAEQVLNPFAWQRGISSFAAKRAGGKIVGKAAEKVTPAPEVTELDARRRFVEERLKRGERVTDEMLAKFPEPPVAPKEALVEGQGIFGIKTNTPFMGAVIKELTQRGYMKTVPREVTTIEEALKLLPRETTMEEGRIITISLMPPAGITKTQARAIETLRVKLIREVTEGVIRPAQQFNQEVMRRFTDLVPEIDRLRMAQAEGNLGVKGLARLKELEGVAIPKAEAVLEAVTPGLGKIIPKKGKVPSKILSEMFPEGLPEEQAAATKWLTDLTRKSKPLTKETLELRKPEHAARAAGYEKILQEEIAKGVPVKQAEREASYALEKEYSKAPLTPAFLEQLKEQGKYEATLLRMIADANFKYGFERKNAFSAFWDLLNEGHLQMNQIQTLERVFGSELAKALLEKNRTWGQKAWFNIVDVTNIPRGLLSMADMSGFGRQGWILTTTRPGEAVKAVMPMIEAMFSEKNAMFLDDVFLNRKHIDKVLRLRPDFLTKWAGEATDIVAREEGFASRWLNKFPVVGQVYKGSTRAYTTVLNDLRTANVSAAISGWEKNGFKHLDLDEAVKLYGNNAKAIFEAKFYTDVDIDMLARTVSWASGRGSLPKELARHAGIANAAFFAPKLIASRLEFPFAVLPGVNPSQLARREAARELLSFIGIGGGILAMAMLSNQADVEIDPRSPDFGKMKIGETRLDIWTGYAQYLRFIAQMATAQGKTASGRIIAKDRLDLIIRFGRSKLSPAAGLIGDLFTGETYLGEDMPPKSAKGVLGQIYQRAMPLAIQDLVDGYLEDSWSGGLIASWAFFGIGAVTYTDEVKRARDKVAQKELGLSWDEVGTKYGRATQLKLEQTPAIIEAEKEHEDRFAGGTPTSMDNFRNEGKLVEDTYRKDVDNAVREFRATNNGKLFREKITKASENRRAAYSLRAKKDEYQDIIAYYTQPIPADKLAEMNPGDVLRREYYQQMFDPIKMYDEFGNYRFDEADKIERKFVVKNGQQAMDYIEEYQGARWQDKPVELKMLEEARELLRPYWDIADKVWEMYPKGLQEISDRINIMENGTDEQQRLAKMQLRKYPMILRARELIVRYKQQMRQYNPAINQAYKMFY